MKNHEEPIMVSIMCITYNHNKFIAKAIEGFLMQKCNFNIEIIIGDDCSQDGTTEIIDAYAAKYTNIRRLPREKNLGATMNLIGSALSARGKYVATCDGDDYWTDPYKLQKQVDFLESHPEYIICAHYTREINAEDTEVTYLNFNPKPLSYSFNDLMVNKQDQTSTVTLLYRNIDEIRKLYQEDWFAKVHACDKFLKLYSTWKTGKRIYVLPETMSCYRRHSGGIWSPVPPVPLKKMQLSDFNIIIKVFKYTPLQKIRLLFFYMKKYLLFEVKYTNLLGALTKIKAIIY